MDFRLSPEQEEFRRAVARFVDAEVAPAAGEIDEAGEFHGALFRRLGEQGYLCAPLPRELRRGGRRLRHRIASSPRSWRGARCRSPRSPRCRVSWGRTSSGSTGATRIRERYLVPALRGEKVATFALTEPNAGSDIGNLTTMRRARRGRLAPSGHQDLGHERPSCRLMLTVCAKTSPERGMKHIALFLVDRQFPGVTLGKRIDKLGVRASATGEIITRRRDRLRTSTSSAAETGGVEKVWRHPVGDPRDDRGPLGRPLAARPATRPSALLEGARHVRQAHRRAPGGDLPASSTC